MIEYIEKLKKDRIFFIDETYKIVRAIKLYNRDYKRFIDYVYKREKSVFAEFLEIHFYPLSLGEVVGTILTKNMSEDQDFLESRVIFQFIKALRDGDISYSVIPEDIHQKIHMENLEYHPDTIYGDLDGFLEIYKDYLTEEQTDKCNKFLERRKQNDTNRNGN